MVKHLWLAYLERKLYGAIETVMPGRFLNTLALRRVAFVTSSDARLGMVEVPKITVDQIINAIKLNESRVDEIINTIKAQ